MNPVIALCGPSGAGKTTVLRAFIADSPGVPIIRRTTTRSRRHEDIDHAEYDFTSQPAFLSALANGEFFDFTEHHGALYGVRLSELEPHLTGAVPAILVSGTASAIRLKKAHPHQVHVAFVYPGDADDLRDMGLDVSSQTNRELSRRLSERASRADDEGTDFDHWLRVRMTRNLSRVAYVLSEMNRGLDVTVVPNYPDHIEAAVATLNRVATADRQATYSNEHLPRKRVGATALYTNAADEILIVKPSYRSGWLTPGGTVDEGESPRSGCLREVHEELGHSFPIIRLLCIEYRPAHDSKVENLQFVFWGGELDPQAIDAIELASGELDEFRFSPVVDLQEYLNSALAHRVRVALEARANGRIIYLEDQSEID